MYESKLKLPFATPRKRRVCAEASLRSVLTLASDGAWLTLQADLFIPRKEPGTH